EAADCPSLPTRRSSDLDALSWYHDAVFEAGAIPGPGTSADFFAGDTTMTITQISRASSLDGSFQWDIVPLPAGPAGQQNVLGQRSEEHTSELQSRFDLG